MRRPARTNFAVRATSARKLTVSEALNLGGATGEWVMAEGDCGDEECIDGAVRQPSDNLQDVLSDFLKYNDETESVIWLHQIEPLQIVRRNDTLGDDTVKISGHLMRDDKVYFVVVPREIVAPNYEIMLETR